MLKTDIINIIERMLDERLKALIVPPFVPYMDVLREVHKVIESHYDIRRGFNDLLIYYKNE